MPRGRLLRTKVREAREIAKATVIGRLKGENQVDKVKYNAKNIGLQLKKRLLELEPSHSAKFVATLGVMVMIHNGIIWTKELVAYGQWAASFGELLGPDPLDLDTLFSSKPKTVEGDLGSEIITWLISYGLAYLIVENFGEIVSAVGAGLSSVVGIAKTMLGAGALAPV